MTPTRVKSAFEALAEPRVRHRFNRPVTFRGYTRRFPVRMTVIAMIPRSLIPAVARYLAGFGYSPLTAPIGLIREALLAVTDVG